MSKILDILSKLEGCSSLEQCVPILDDLKLSNEELRITLEAKFYGDRTNMLAAYRTYGERLIHPNFRETIKQIIYDGSPRKIETSGAIL